MGREIRRVPLEFNWPLNKTWGGFLNPLYKPCPAEVAGKCSGGYTNAGQWLSSICRLVALVGEQALEEPIANELRARGQLYPHPYLENWEQAPRIEPPRELRELMRKQDMAASYRTLMEWKRGLPTTLAGFGGDEMIAFVSGLAENEKPHRMQGSNYGWAIEKTLRTAAGLPKEWGVCRVCDGHAIDPDVRDAYEAWEKIPPPPGEGWQLWETVSEGSPISPVFATREHFMEYLVSEGSSRNSAEKFCESGWAPSMIMAGGQIATGINALGLLESADAQPKSTGG